MKSFMLALFLVIDVQVTNGLTVGANAKSSLLSHKMSFESVHVSTAHAARVNQLMEVNPQATKELCDACVGAEEDLVANQTLLEDALRNFSGTTQTLLDANTAYAACLVEEVGLKNTLDSAEQALRTRLDAAKTELTALTLTIDSTLSEVNVPDPPGAVSQANPDKSYDGSGLLALTQAWEAAFNAHATKAAECANKHEVVQNATALANADNATVITATNNVDAANATAVEKCDAMKAGYREFPTCFEYFKNGQTESGPYNLSNGDSPSFSTYCDMTTLGGGWTMVAKVKGKDATLNRLNTAQWQTGTPLNEAGMSNLIDANAFGTAYSTVPFTDVMIRSISDADKRVSWRHPTEYTSMHSIAQACTSISDGSPLEPGTKDGPAALDFDNNANYKALCTSSGMMKYGFFGFDYSYDVTDVVGCNVQYMGHSGGFIAVSSFTTSPAQTSCVTDFGVGSGYYNMASGDDTYAINAHWWGAGNSYSHDFNTHAVFVRQTPDWPLGPTRSGVTLRSTCGEYLAAGYTESGSYDLLTVDGSGAFSTYCDMTTLGGGWTMVAKVKGKDATLNRLNTAQWQSGVPLNQAGMFTLDDENAFGTAYSTVPFTDVMIRSISDADKRLSWRHPNEYSSMLSIAQACTSISDGVLLESDKTGPADLDFDNNANYKALCTSSGMMKYGFFGYDYSYDVTDVVGCNVQYMGHSGGFIAVSSFTTSPAQTSCVTDFGVGSGYYNMASGDDTYAINAHWWGAGNSYSHDFNTHAVFVRKP
jgi:uncharacterized protein YbdZ (MbtH family)